MTIYSYELEYQGQKVKRKSTRKYVCAIVNSWTDPQTKIISIFSILFFESYIKAKERNNIFHGTIIEVPRGQICA
jgi:hypothetical protein